MPWRQLLPTDNQLYGKLFNKAGIRGSVDSNIAASDVENFKKMQIRECILFTASVFSMTSNNLSYAYMTSKNAVVGLAKNLSVELGQHGIWVNCISPYAVVTPLAPRALGMEKKRFEELTSEAGILKGAVLEVKDIAESVAVPGEQRV
ncbi:hypothetical protein CDL15_Pgr003221 [Punica granatum]|uniref:Secoisolariciresinol dehydrogenase-like n=1 Tax=Punica granatum TaxID=22663 RepID=A0A218X2Z8_PUNGR|nr:hypothetical protein CDL15_Pgr003221 [Punica granatum]